MTQSTQRNHFQNLTFKVGVQWFSFPLESIKDVMYTPKLTPVPLSPLEVAGLINLRGHIVTSLYASYILGIESEIPIHHMSIVMQDADDELYSLIVDKVFDIETLNGESFETLPMNLQDIFGPIAQGVFREDDRLILALDPQKTLMKIKNP